MTGRLVEEVIRQLRVGEGLWVEEVSERFEEVDIRAFWESLALLQLSRNSTSVAFALEFVGDDCFISVSNEDINPSRKPACPYPPAVPPNAPVLLRVGSTGKIEELFLKESTRTVDFKELSAASKEARSKHLVEAVCGISG